MIIRPTRRSLILGIGASLLAAPAIVRISSLMPVKAIKPVKFEGWVDELRIANCHLAPGTFTVEGWFKWRDGPWEHRRREGIVLPATTCLEDVVQQLTGGK